MENGNSLHMHERPIYVVSGGAGASGELLVRTVLAQFPTVRVPVQVFSAVHETRQIDDVIAQAVADQATIVHTLVKDVLREYLREAAELHHVPAVDLLSGLLTQLATQLGELPLGQPGRYRQLNANYFQRIQAIEYAVTHDDGQRISEIDQAEIVLVGVSRVGKTPLSIYLSLQGWKVANIPVVPGITLPSELLAIERARIVGLMIQPQQLLIYRRWRHQRLGIAEGDYTNQARIGEELRAANHLFHDEGIATIDVTDKPIETTSDEVIMLVNRRLSLSVST